jgi:hypothetical protein
MKGCGNKTIKVIGIYNAGKGEGLKLIKGAGEP